ncbi:hypothetical protein GE061_009229 [Apolygus lucorum]|uniref:Nuclear pore complex protein Nup205 n=1 Tax=Apolygus lucorum TaxID=248454 RepID=A0A8S9Y2B5_APOLU|nr:hypothetical protein GE061_009229 [Apolygus lucorum]
MEDPMDDIWTPYKELQDIVENSIAKHSPTSFDELKRALARHRQNFLTLLKNPPKDRAQRAELQKGQPIDLPGVGATQLPKDLVDEAIILSDMYDLNEYMALDLLGTAQQRLPDYPDLPRGVVAVLLYYDGRKSLVMALRTLVQARKGNLWTVETAPQVSDYVTAYTDELLDDGIIPKILSVLEAMDVNKEKELLQQNRALGPPRYQQQVLELYESTRQALAETVFLWSAQSGLPKEPCFALLNHLRSCKRNVADSPDALPTIDVTPILTLAFLYAIDLSLLHKADGDVVQRVVPLVMGNRQYLGAMQEELSNRDKQWGDEGLRSLILMGWAVTLSTLRMAPQILPENVPLSNPDVVMEEAIQCKVFDYLRLNFMNHDLIYKQEFALRRIHSLVTDFITQMPHKVKEMRLRAEETDKTIHAYMHEGLEPPTNLSHHFEHLLLSIARLYSQDPLNTQLAMDYWCTPDTKRGASFPYRAQPKKEALYTFVVQTSEVLPSTLFVPYVKMLTSLSSSPRGAQQCFHLLKNNDNKNLTWDHFFSSFNRYFHNLRQEALPTGDTMYRTQTFNKGITQAELEGLQAVLGLIKSVAENDPVTGERLCQNQQWAAMTVLLGLVTCSVPIPLKASLLNTLAAFTKSPATAASLWHNIEASQIVTTIPSTSSFQPRGILTELEEVECRNEEYPLTRAVLNLFNGLTDKPIPKLLGASQRTPGFDPYLNFILNNVLLRFAGRCYKDPKEKWEVCQGAMALISKLLLQYDPSKDEFLAKHVQAYTLGTAQVNPPPGYHIMISLCSKSELLRLLLLLIDEGCRVFDVHNSFPGKTELENSVLYALKMLQHGLEMQPMFLNLLNSSNSNILLVGLNRLILGVNEVTNKPDHLLNIAKYVTYQSWLPKHALPAVNILTLVTSDRMFSSPPLHGHLLSLFLSSPQIKSSIRHGFVTCLEMEEEVVEGSEEDILEAEEDDPRRVITETKRSICLFLLQTLQQGVPNVAHYLFGFDLNKEIRKTVFQQPGVLGMPRSCLHSILGLLNTHLVNLSQNSGSLVELYYRIIYALAYNTRTSEPTLRFLRSSGDFLKRHLAALPFTTTFDDPTSVTRLRQMSWLLKTVAIEMKVTATNQQLSQLASLVQTYTGCSKDMRPASNESTNYPLSLSFDQVKPGEQLVLQLLKHTKFRIQSVPDPELEFVNVARLKKLMKDCEVDEERIRTVDVRTLHIALENELNLQSKSTSNTHRIEIQTILAYVTKVNAAARLKMATIRFLDAWRHATEVMFAVATNDALNLEKRFNLLVDVIHEMLSKAVQSASQPEIANLISGSVLLLFVDLRQTYISEMGKGDETDSKLCNFMDSNHYKLTTVLTNLVKWILNSGAGPQKVRANLYAALLNFFHLSREKSDLRKKSCLDQSRRSDYVTMLDATVTGHGGVITDRSNIDVILAQGERLVDMLCHDCSTSHDICKMLALSCLDMIVEIDAATTWTSVLSSRGYLKYIIDSLLDMDKHLIQLLSNNVKNLKPLYVYESKMALLCRVASTKIGAEMLLDQNALSCLSALHVYNKHPDIIPNAPMVGGMETDFVPNVTTRYLQILMPALDLCDAVISSMGVENQIAIAQVLKFLLCHGEMVTLVLRSGSPFHTLPYLKELAKLTGIIARATNEDALRSLNEDGMDPGSLFESTSVFSRIRRLMLGLVSRFVCTESLLRDIEKDADDRQRRLDGDGDSQPSAVSKKASSEVVTAFLQIAAHLVLYARNVVSNGSADRRISTVVFQPALTDSCISDRRDMLTMQEATLGDVVLQLSLAVSHHGREKSNLDVLVKKLQDVPKMDSNTLKQYVEKDSDEPRHEATRILTYRVESKRLELQLCHFIVEHCLYIVWAHLDFYMLRGLSNKTFGQPKTPRGFGRGPAPMEFDTTWAVSHDDLDQLKQGLLSVFNDSFSTSLLTVVQDMSDKEKSFLEALLRRIKKLIQFVPN